MEDIKKVVLGYFEDLFSSSLPSNSHLDAVINAIDSSLDPTLVEHLSAPFTSDKVIGALKQMHPCKAPSPNGIPVLFFNSFWHIVGNDVIKLVLNFLKLGIMPPNINHTFITLVPKVASPKSMKDLRPISLCNVIYKIMSKVLANRLKLILPVIINESQSAFVPNRLITENAIITLEIFHSIKHRQKVKKAILLSSLTCAKPMVK